MAKERMGFRWETVPSAKGGTIRIRVDENGVKIPKKDWETFDMFELDERVEAGSTTRNRAQERVAPKPAPKVHVNPYSLEVDNSKLLLKKDGNTVLSGQIKGFPGCCGMREFCSLLGYPEGNLPDLMVTDDFKNTLDEGLKKLMVALSNPENDRCYTAVVTLKDRGVRNSNDAFREAFERTGLFVMVKDFTNQNTGNHLELYVSTN